MINARNTPYAARFFEVPGWVSDPLLDDVTRFAAARGQLGPVALMRRFKIGLSRAKYLMRALDDRHLLMSYVQGGRVVSVNPRAWGALCATGRVDYVTCPAESLAGMACRQLKDERRWIEIRDINAHAFPEMGPHDYYPVGTRLSIPGR